MKQVIKCDSGQDGSCTSDWSTWRRAGSLHSRFTPFESGKMAYGRRTVNEDYCPVCTRSLPSSSTWGQWVTFKVFTWKLTVFLLCVSMPLRDQPDKWKHIVLNLYIGSCMRPSVHLFDHILHSSKEHVVVHSNWQKPNLSTGNFENEITDFDAIGTGCPRERAWNVGLWSQEVKDRGHIGQK